MDTCWTDIELTGRHHAQRHVASVYAINTCLAAQMLIVSMQFDLLSKSIIPNFSGIAMFSFAGEKVRMRLRPKIMHWQERVIDWKQSVL
jgi:hypothetical protein